MQSLTLVIACPDRVGLVAEVSGLIAEMGGSLLEASYHTDPDSSSFFMRNEIAIDSLSVSVEEFRQRFTVLADSREMRWTLRESAEKRRVAILASHASHCVVDLLHRWKSGDLDCEVCCVIANHDNLRRIVEWHGVPFHYVPIAKEKAEKALGFSQIEEVIDRYRAETIVLARFMQIMPPDLCAKYQGQVINIHHSFLPAFIGANPYRKAHERGVKLIGATCHYVTTDLDEGPIIDQDVIRVGHKHSYQDLARLGKDVEARVLARGLHYHLQDRAIIQGNKTVIFD